MAFEEARLDSTMSRNEIHFVIVFPDAVRLGKHYALKQFISRIQAYFLSHGFGWG